ncbi:hypothetical protein HOD20_01375, partial [archaeon]|nr:hypothetical protein [archaeon]
NGQKQICGGGNAVVQNLDSTQNPSPVFTNTPEPAQEAVDQSGACNCHGSYGEICTNNELCCLDSCGCICDNGDLFQIGNGQKCNCQNTVIEPTPTPIPTNIPLSSPTPIPTEQLNQLETNQCVGIYCTHLHKCNSNSGCYCLCGSKETSRTIKSGETCNCEDGFHLIEGDCNVIACKETEVCSIYTNCYCFCKKYESSDYERNSIIPKGDSCTCPPVMSDPVVSEPEPTILPQPSPTEIPYDGEKYKYIFYIVPIGGWSRESSVDSYIKSSLSALIEISKFKSEDISYKIVPLDEMENNGICSKIKNYNVDWYNLPSKSNEFISCAKDSSVYTYFENSMIQEVFVIFDANPITDKGGFAGVHFWARSGNYFYLTKLVLDKSGYSPFAHEFTHLFGVCDEYELGQYNYEVFHYLGCANKFPEFCKSVETCKEEFGDGDDICEGKICTERIDGENYNCIEGDTGCYCKRYTIMDFCPGNFLDLNNNNKLGNCESEKDRNGDRRYFSIMGTGYRCGLDPVAYELVDPKTALN